MPFDLKPFADLYLQPTSAFSFANPHPADPHLAAAFARSGLTRAIGSICQYYGAGPQAEGQTLVYRNAQTGLTFTSHRQGNVHEVGIHLRAGQLSATLLEGHCKTGQVPLYGVKAMNLPVLIGAEKNIRAILQVATEFNPRRSQGPA